MITYKPTSPIRAITFDLDDTLYDNWPFIRAAESYLHQYIETHYPRAARFSSRQWHSFKKSALAERPELKHDMGELRAVTLTKAFVQCGMRADQIPAAVGDCFDAFYFKRSDFTVSTEIRACLNKLSRRVPLVAITNGNVNLKQIGITRYFEYALHANLNQRMKPYPDMFEHAAALLQLAPNSILHVGDNLEKDIWAATRVGYSTAWYACNREMNINREHVMTLPHLQLSSLTNLEDLVR